MTSRFAAISTSEAPQAIGPYSQAIAAQTGRMVFCSGQIALDPKTGTMISGDVSHECTRVMQNLEAVLRAAGAEFSSVVRCTIYLVDMNDFAAVNAVYGSYFKSTPPARATVAVAGLPKGARVEIDALAVV